MNKEITSSIQVDYWKNSSVVIKWFRNLENNSSSLVIRYPGLLPVNFVISF